MSGERVYPASANIFQITPWKFFELLFPQNPYPEHQIDLMNLMKNFIVDDSEPLVAFCSYSVIVYKKVSYRQFNNSVTE